MSNTPTTLPRPGTWLRPVGHIRYAYTYEVLGIHPPGEWDSPDAGWRISARRWGQDEASRPVDDGRIQDGHSVSGLQPVQPGQVWRCAQRSPRSGCMEPLYFRRTSAPACRQAARVGQLELFAA